jgi:adenylosuccinate synthase
MGDEGKGKIVDVLTSKYDIIALKVDQMLDIL